MKKFLLLLLTLILCSPVYSQRSGSSTRGYSQSRGSISTSARTSSPSRNSSTATYRSSSRSSISTGTRTNTRSSYSSRNSMPSRSSMVSNERSTSRSRVEPTEARRNTTVSPRSSRLNIESGRPSGRPRPSIASNKPNHSVHHPGPAHHHRFHYHGHYYRPHHTFYHPVYHRHIYMRPVYWDPWVWVTPVYWHGWWHYCYTYPSTDIVVVKQYVKDTYDKEIIAYTVFNEFVYSIVKEDGNTYIEIFSNADELVFKHEISRKYNNIVADEESDGVWLLKKNGKDPLFIGHDDSFYIYETD